MKKIVFLFCLCNGYLLCVGGSQKKIKINPYVKKIENIFNKVKNGTCKLNEQESPFLTLESLKKELDPVAKIKLNSEKTDEKIVEETQQALVLLKENKIKEKEKIQAKFASNVMSDSELDHVITTKIYTGLAGGALFLLGECLPETVNVWVKRTCKITGGFLGVYGFYTAKKYREHSKKKQELDDLIQQEELLNLAQIQVKDLGKFFTPIKEEQKTLVVEISDPQQDEQKEEKLHEAIKDINFLDETEQDTQEEELSQHEQIEMDSSVIVNTKLTPKVLENHFASDTNN